MIKMPFSDEPIRMKIDPAKVVYQGSGGSAPTIGENGNWYIDGVDTGKPSRGEQGPAGPQGETGPQGEPGEDYTLTDADKTEIAEEAAAALAGTSVPTPATAAVGQIVKVKAVDADGKITQTEAVDMPSSGAPRLVLDYVHDESKFSDFAPIYPTAYDADTGVWTTDGQVDLTTLAAVGAEVGQRLQLNIIDPALLLNQNFDRTKWAYLVNFKMKVLSANTFSGLTPNITPTDFSHYIIIPNRAVVLNLPTGLSNKIRFEFEGQFGGATRYPTFGSTQWFDPNSATTIANQIAYQQRHGIFNHIISDFELRDGYIRGTTRQIFVSAETIGNEEGEYYPYAADSWPTQIVLSVYAHVYYAAMPYKGRLRIYDMG